MAAFTADYSRSYQSQQTCHCDNDHDKCSADNQNNWKTSSNGMLKRSRRLRRVCLLTFLDEILDGFILCVCFSFKGDFEQRKG